MQVVRDAKHTNMQAPFCGLDSHRRKDQQKQHRRLNPENGDIRTTVHHDGNKHANQQYAHILAATAANPVPQDSALRNAI